jgi:hypothetical protein
LAACDVSPDSTSLVTAPRTGEAARASVTRSRAAIQPVRFASPPGRVLTQSAAAVMTLEGESCGASEPISLPLDEAIDIPGSTTETNDAAKTYCADPSDETSANDQTFELVLPADCTLSLSLETSEGFEGAFELQTGCRAKGDQLGCVNGTNGTSLVRAMGAGTYYVVVDGVNSTAGDFTLHATCATPVCGDGVRNSATEACDGGADPIDGDGCTDASAEGGCEIESVPAADTCAEVTAIPLTLSSSAVMPAGSMPSRTWARSPRPCNPG